MRLADLLSIPRLGMRFLSGADRGHLPLRRVYTTDLLRPTRYLAGDDLVLTGMLWRTAPEDSDVFVTSLVEAGATAVGAGTAVGTVPDDLIEACDRHGLPLLEVPAETSFGVITEEVLRLLSGHRFTVLAEARDRSRKFLAEIASGADFSEVFPAAAEQMGRQAWVLSSTGRSVAEAGPRLPAGERARIARAALTCSSFPHAVRSSRPQGRTQRKLSVLPVQTQQAHPLSRWLLVCAGDHRSWPEESQETVAELLSLAVLARSRVEERVLAGARHAADLPKLLAELRHQEAAALLHAGGMRDAQEAGHLVLSAELVPTPVLPDLARRVTAELLAGYPQTIVTGDHDVLAVIDVSGATEVGNRMVERVRTELEERLHVLAGGLERYRMCLGIGATVRRLDELPGAAQEAQHARRLARMRTGRSHVVTGTEIDTHELLLASVPVEVRETYRERLLGALLEYDRTHRSALVETLERFLEYSGSWQRCADALHVHVSTLRYRIGRVEELTGRDLSRLDHRTDLLLALRLRE